MDGHVIEAGNALGELGYNAELFGGRSDLVKKTFKDQVDEIITIEEKKYSWKEITTDFKTGDYEKDPVTGFIPDSELPNTLIYKTNKVRSETLLSEGYRIIDIGYPSGISSKSLFHDMLCLPKVLQYCRQCWLRWNLNEQPGFDRCF